MARLRTHALRFAALVVAVSALGAAYWFTRPPELVWWRSPPIGKTAMRVCALVPKGWEVRTQFGSASERLQLDAEISDGPLYDTRPVIMRTLLPRRWVPSNIHVTVEKNLYKRPRSSTAIHTQDEPGVFTAFRYIDSGDLGAYACIAYNTPNLSDFNRTYRQICNSLRIE